MMLTNYNQLILPNGISPISTGGRKKRSRKYRTRRHKKSNKSRSRRRHN